MISTSMATARRPRLRPRCWQGWARRRDAPTRRPAAAHERFRGLFRRPRRTAPPASPVLYVEAAAIAQRLLANPREVRPLHGDLHHENIMHGPRGWLAIDPVGLLGDPGFDAANLFYNPLDRDDLCLDPERIAFMADIFARTLGQDVLGDPRPRHRLWLPVGVMA